MQQKVEASLYLPQMTVHWQGWKSSGRMTSVLLPRLSYLATSGNFAFFSLSLPRSDVLLPLEPHIKAMLRSTPPVFIVGFIGGHGGLFSDFVRAVYEDLSVILECSFPRSW